MNWAAAAEALRKLLERQSSWAAALWLVRLLPNGAVNTAATEPTRSKATRIGVQRGSRRRRDRTISRLAASTGTERPIPAIEKLSAIPPIVTTSAPASTTNRPEDFCTDRPFATAVRYKAARNGMVATINVAK